MKTSAAPSIEPLEARIAPANFTLTFTDVDGDLATLTVSGSTDADVTTILSAASGPYGGQQLELVRLSDTVPQGANVSLTAKRQDADGDGRLDGDGRVNLGRFVAGFGIGLIGGRDLGVLNFSGDVGHLRIGDSEGSDNGFSFKSLTVGSLGLYGATATGAGVLNSEIYGKAGTLKILGDIAAGASLRSFGTGATTEVVSSLTIGGSVAGTLAVSATKAIIEGDITGLVEDGRYGSLTIEGSLLGGLADQSGLLKDLYADSLRIVGDVLGGTGDFSGSIANGIDSSFTMYGFLRAILIGGSISGGAGDFSGAILVPYEIESLTIAGDLRAGTGIGSGYIASNDEFAASPELEIGALTIGGSLIGGAAERSGMIEAEGLKNSMGDFAELGGVVKIGGDVVGGSASNTAQLYFVFGRSVTIDGSVVGGGGSYNFGQLFVFGGLERLTIGGDLRAGAGNSSGRILATGLDEFIVGGSLLGSIVMAEAIGKLSIGGDLQGGEFAVDAITAGTIGGSLIGASIDVEETIGSLDIKGSVRAGTTISAGGLEDLENGSDLTIGRLTIGGSVEDSVIEVDRREVGTVTVGGDWVASSLRVGGGTSSDRISRLGSLTIKGMALGTPAPDDAAIFSIVAQEIVRISIAGKAEPMQAGPGNDTLDFRNPLGATLHSDGSGDLRAYELPVTGATPAPPVPIVAPRPVANADFTYTDVDGDLVSVVVSKGTPVFNTMPRGPFANGVQLTSIDFQLDPTAAGANITVTAQRQDANGDGFLDGDGLVNVGEIKAFAVPLGTVTIRGDLGAIEAGGASQTGIKKLAVLSLGRFGTTTGAADIASGIVGRIGSVVIGTNLAGTLNAESFGSVTLGGSLTGTLDATNGALGKVTVAGDLRGTMQGLTIGAVSIDGSVTGDAAGGGKISATNRFTGAVKIGGDFRGELANAARIYSGGDLPGLTIGGAMHGFAASAATVEVLGNLGKISIARDVAGTALNTASISAEGRLTTVSIGGSFTGTANLSAQISASSLGTVAIAGDMRGGNFGALIESTGGAISKVMIGGSLLADLATVRSAQIVAEGDLGTVKIGRDIRGSGGESAYISAAGDFKSLTIGGSLVGGAGVSSGEIAVAGDLRAAKIGLNVIGGTLLNGGGALARSGYIEAKHIGTITLGGSLVAGADESPANTITQAGSIRASDDIASLTIGGNVSGAVRVVGGVEQFAPAIISARGQDGASGARDVAIGKLTIRGSVTDAIIYAGYSTTLAGLNADAQIGSVSVDGDFRASTLIAGVAANANGFGNADDARLTGASVKDLADDTGAISKIARLTIKGVAFGNLDPDDGRTFAIAAQQIGKTTLGPITLSLLAGASNDTWAANAQRPLARTTDQSIPAGFDFHLFEV